MRVTRGLAIGILTVAAISAGKADAQVQEIAFTASAGVAHLDLGDGSGAELAVRLGMWYRLPSGWGVDVAAMQLGSGSDYLHMGSFGGVPPPPLFVSGNARAATLKVFRDIEMDQWQLRLGGGLAYWQRRPAAEFADDSGASAVLSVSARPTDSRFHVDLEHVTSLRATILTVGFDWTF